MDLRERGSCSRRTCGLTTARSPTPVSGDEEVDPALTNQLFAAISDALTDEMREDGVILYWRKRPEIASYIDDRGRQCRRIRCRLFIPGISFPQKAEGQPTPVLG